MEKPESSGDKIAKLEKELKELKSVLGDKQLKVEYYQELLRLAEEKHGISLEKNSDTQRWKR